ncbi:subtilisin-like protein [Schizopora paradoxa]|uniref:tripeptidyl-peptidase II n=1 Tax=Schizopora paradoxa TaxID=27342 RepID=A0A0H2RVB1_9AGAM|nr:subtilisin-like protein [Schizopora paradoxa]
MRFLDSLALFLLALSVDASRISRTGYVVHEKRDIIPTAWTRTRRLESEAVLPMRFGLQQQNIHRLEEILMDVSHPESPNYGKHWTPAQLAETFSARRESIEAVKTWLEGEGISADRMRLSPSRGWIDFNATVDEIESILQAEYHVFKHEDTGKEHVACDSYSVPHHVKEHIDLIIPTLHFDAKINAVAPKRMAKRDSVPVEGAARNVGKPGVGLNPTTTGKVSKILGQLENCDSQITPDCLRALYEVVYKQVATEKNSYGIVEYTTQAFLGSDLGEFSLLLSKHSNETNTLPSLVGKRPKFVATVNQSFNFNGESDLDLEYGMALAAPLKVTLYQAGDIPEGASFNNLLDALDASYCTFEGGDDPTQDGIYPDPLPGGFTGPESCGIVKPANIISTSYASDEADLTPFYAIRQCNEYGKLGIMGTTILYSSGDHGVAGNSGVCLNPNGTQSIGGTRFNPLFPAVCPFVTAVGATQVNPNSTVFEPESASEQVIFSGGGFSNVFKRPSYQDAAVEGFLTNHPPPFTSTQFNTSGSRGFPDISANGVNYVVAVDGEFSLVFGTSCSSPVLGAILTLINDARLAIGKSPIGFINPTIYSEFFKGALNDITSGGNQGTPGFTAASGWDPVTGLGTPNFPKLLARWLLLP